jgi:hypothetical protein
VVGTAAVGTVEVRAVAEVAESDTDFFREDVV